MANANAATTNWNAPNYVGVLFMVGESRTPLLNMMGGLSGGNVSTYDSMEFPVNQEYSLESASQPDITETASLSAPTPVTYVRSANTNTCQIFQRKVSVSYSKQSQSGVTVADATTGRQVPGQNPVTNEVDFQTKAHIEQIALDYEYSALNGTFQQATDAATSAKMRGIITAASTNSINASSAAISVNLIDQLMKAMADNNSPFRTPIIMVNSFQKQKLSKLYGFASNNQVEVGGVVVGQILTDFAQVGVAFNPHVPAATLALIDVAYCGVVFNPVPEKGLLFSEPLQKAGASDDKQIYGHLGVQYGAERFHGVITNLATS